MASTTGKGDVFLRARHYRLSLGIFPSLDPFESVFDKLLRKSDVDMYAVTSRNSQFRFCLLGQKCGLKTQELHKTYLRNLKQFK